MSKSTHSLADVYDLSISRLFLTGPQAILRLVLMQSERDRQAGLDTAGYVSGYRGSPVGTVDNQFMVARSVLEPRNIKFQAGLNEDLAATAIWGTQQAEMRGEGRHDGVFALWYGKGPGVDRTGDVFRHANMAGTSPHGGVLAIAGDDHSGEVLDRAACQRYCADGRDDPGAGASGRAGDHRLRASGLRIVSLRRGVGGPQMRA